jgi:hypothetical protein
MSNTSPMVTMTVSGSYASAGPFAITSTAFSNHTHIVQGTNLRIRKIPDPPTECGNRRGGPRSRIYCKIFKEVPHSIHIGASNKGIWYRWED